MSDCFLLPSNLSLLSPSPQSPDTEGSCSREETEGLDVALCVRTVTLRQVSAKPLFCGLGLPPQEHGAYPWVLPSCPLAGSGQPLLRSRAHPPGRCGPWQG